MSIATFLDKINNLILNPLILLAFAIAFLYFFIGILQFIIAAQTGKVDDTAKKKILYGLIGMFIMFSAYGLIRLILTTFGLRGSANSNQSYIQF